MKKSTLLIFALLFVSAQILAQKFSGLDKSPMDMAYYPHDFAHDRKFAIEKVGKTLFARITYSRTAKKDREIFGKLVPYGKIWRVGANEAPEIKFVQNVSIGGKTLKAGAYSVFAIPTESDWTIIFNTDLDVWGAYSYDETKDVLRVKATSKKVDEVIDNLSIQFTKSGEKEAIMQMGWDKTVVELPIKFE
jgi:Protein of unknown function (DUF2911)